MKKIEFKVGEELFDLSTTGGAIKAINALFAERHGAGRDFERIRRICEKLERVWSLNPDLRLGQLIYQVGHFNEDANMRDIFNVEDSIVEEWLDNQLQSIYEAKGCGRD